MDFDLTNKKKQKKQPSEKNVTILPPQKVKKSKPKLTHSEKVEKFIKGDVPKKRRGDWDKFVKEIKSQFTSSTFWNFGVHAGVRERVLDISLEMLRTLARREPFFRAITNLRKDQVKMYAQPQKVLADTGYQVFDKHDKPRNDLIKFMEHTGFGPSPDVPRLDKFGDFIQKAVEDAFVIDQVCIELRRNRSGRIYDFMILDGSTIRRTTSFLGDEYPFEYKLYEENGIEYVQIIDGVVTAEYQKQDLMFNCMFPSNEVERYGYGYSYMEQAVDVVTSFLLGLDYNKKQFKYDNLPRGIVAMPGADKDTITAIQEYWQEVVQGVGGKWKIPIVGTPPASEGGDVKWLGFGNTNREMEYYRYISLLMNLIAAITGVDLAELGIRNDNSTNIIGNESVEARQKFSRSRGLTAILRHLENICNAIIKEVDPTCRFEFVGIPRENEQETLTRIQTELATFRTINEILIERGEKPKKMMIGSKGSGRINVFDIPGILNPTISQLAQKAVEGDQGGGMGGMDMMFSKSQENEKKDKKNQKKLFENDFLDIFIEEDN